jgi:heptaprenylglyceryl phosphate synthase
MVLQESQIGRDSEGLFDDVSIMRVYQNLRREAAESGRTRSIVGRIETAGPIMVIDPEKAYYDLPATLEKVRIASRMGMSVMEIGGSTDQNGESETVIPETRKAIDEARGDTLLISFPGTSSQVVKGVDATFSLFLPQLDGIFRQRPQVAEILKAEYLTVIDRSRQLDIPLIPVTYILFNGGKKTSVEKATGVDAINVQNGADVGGIMKSISPWLDKGDLVMLEMGSGPDISVNLGPVAREVYEVTKVRPIVTGGINSPDIMREVTKYLETPVVFGSVGEQTSIDEFENLYEGFRVAHPFTR